MLLVTLGNTLDEQQRNFPEDQSLGKIDSKSTSPVLLDFQSVHDYSTWNLLRSGDADYVACLFENRKHTTDWQKPREAREREREEQLCGRVVTYT